MSWTFGKSAPSLSFIDPLLKLLFDVFLPKKTICYTLHLVEAKLINEKGTACQKLWCVGFLGPSSRKFPQLLKGTSHHRFWKPVMGRVFRSLIEDDFLPRWRQNCACLEESLQIGLYQSQYEYIWGLWSIWCPTFTFEAFASFLMWTRGAVILRVMSFKVCSGNDWTLKR